MKKNNYCTCNGEGITFDAKADDYLCDNCGKYLGDKEQIMSRNIPYGYDNEGNVSNQYIDTWGALPPESEEE